MKTTDRIVFISTIRNPRCHDELLNYRLKRLLQVSGAPAIRLCEGRFGVSRFQWRVLAALVEDGPMSPGALTARVAVDRGRVSLGVAALVEKGLIARQQHEGDKRRATLAATPAGEELYRELFPQLAAINRRLASVLTEEEALHLEDYLQRLAAHAKAIYDEGGGVDVRADRRHGGSRRVAASVHDRPR